MNHEFIELDISEIRSHDKLRSSPGDTTTLENSIRKLGLLCPVIVDPKNIMISGYRRLAASKKVGLSRIPAIRVDVPADSMTALDIQSDENLCRKPLSPGELQDHIQVKKSLLGGEHGSGVINKLKRIFGHG
jgi:ParB/RepB/Spo0J family partition protein